MSHDSESLQDHPLDILQAFRVHYIHFEELVHQSMTNMDSTVLARLGDDLDNFQALLIEASNSSIFESNELSTIRLNLSMMRVDVQLQYQKTLDESHHGRPTIIEPVYTGNRGRPYLRINRDFLQWAYTHRSTTGIARFLNINRDTVRNALLDYGITEPQQDPFRVLLETEDAGDTDVGTNPDSTVHEHSDDLLDPDLILPTELPADILSGWPVAFFTARLSTLTDDQLDNLTLQLRSHFCRAGISMLDGMLRRLGHRLPRERIRQSLMRINPVQRVFQRIRIRRRTYSVPGPNALWHHDGQHGLIRWGIVIHGFIDGYSRLITGLRASDNNFGTTVLNLFLCSAHVYGVPSRLRGDHGVENILVATWMEENCGPRRYIWGRSVHNVRIERLWVDVTAQVGESWAERFVELELQYGLDINNINHIWLLHHLFLHSINLQLSFFAESWNQHRIQIRDGPNRSPADLFGFDMLVHGVRGAQLPLEEVSNEELEVYGVDWEGLRDERLIRSNASNNPISEGWSSWTGQGPPSNLNEVDVQPPSGPLSWDEVGHLDEGLPSLPESIVDAGSIYMQWTHALAHVRTLRNGIF